MNFKENESEQKLRGGYYTGLDIVKFLCRWVGEINPELVLEPSCGDGAFLRGLQMLKQESIRKFTGIEIDKDEADKARTLGIQSKSFSVEIINTDFLAWSLRQILNPPLFDAVVGNPPFIRYQYLDKKLQSVSSEIFKAFNLRYTRHTNAWVPFVVTSLALLRPGGRLAMVLPSELLHILHAESLRDFLYQRCSKILIIDPQDIMFEDTLQGAILLLAEKKTAPQGTREGIAIKQMRDRSFLQDNPIHIFDDTVFSDGSLGEGKWMKALLSQAERELIDTCTNLTGVSSFEEIAEVAVGIVTGANKFFLVDENTVEQFDLGKWTYPMFGRSEHVPGVIYDQSTHEQNTKKGLPTHFLWLNSNADTDYPMRLKKYLRLGEQQGIHNRYKCRIRTPWYEVPSVYSTNIAMLKRSHNFPRLIHNRISAFTTDTAYRIKSLGIDEKSFVFSFVNSLTALSAELEGRHYGGGVLELVPSEIRKIIIPHVQAEESDILKLDEQFSTGTDAEEILAYQDRKILEKVGLSQNDSEILRSAWRRLRNRRQRK